jgi:RNA polymerase sigma-70 factor (ECF subfamily)
MLPRDSFAELMTRLRAGEDTAANEVFQRFARRLHGLAQRHLDSALRHKVDAEDVVQSAYKSFFLRYGAGTLEVNDWNNLWGLLTLIALRKCADRAEHYRAERRAVSREVGPDTENAGSGWQAIDREPTPVEAALLAETVEQLLTTLDADERPIIELSLQGYTTQEISERLGRAERSVRRLRERVRKRLERTHQEGLQGP